VHLQLGRTPFAQNVHRGPSDCKSNTQLLETSACAGSGYESARARASEGIARASKQWDEQQARARNTAGQAADAASDQVGN
jgi:ElaB/YqjD/DUF883 family membrane-anchored ribosome-binding protein